MTDINVTINSMVPQASAGSNCTLKTFCITPVVTPIWVNHPSTGNCTTEPTMLAAINTMQRANVMADSSGESTNARAVSR